MLRNPLDRAAIGAIGALAIVIAALILRGDQVGVQVISRIPPENAYSVATRIQLAVTFSEPMPAGALDGRIIISPPVSGTLRWNGSTGFFAPAHPLQSDTAYTMTILAGARSERGRLMLRDAVWSFRTGHPRVVFLSPATGIGDLYIRDPGDSAPPT
ncbi:MAG TPA: Ig-like domain-containing protein, partial [Anaerolineae bacterium]